MWRRESPHPQPLSPEYRSEGGPFFPTLVFAAEWSGDGGVGLEETAEEVPVGGEIDEDAAGDDVAAAENVE